MTDKEFDDLLRRRYEDHIIEPEKSLWEGINTRLYQKKIDRNIRKVRQLKIAISSVAAILAGVIVYSIISTKENKHETQIISGIPVTSAPAENESLLESGLNNEINSAKSEYSYKTEQEKFNPESKEKKNVLIKETPALSARFFIPVTGIILPDYLQAPSVKIVEHKQSVLPRGQIISDINKSYDIKLTDLNSIMCVPEKPNQPELRLQEAYRGTDRPGGLTTSENSQRHTRFFFEGYVSPEISYRLLMANTRYSIPDYGKTYFNKTEMPDMTFSTGVSGGIRITDNLILKTGAHYSRYSYKLKTEAFNLINTGSDGYRAYTSSGAVNITLISSDSLSTESLVTSSLNFSYLNVPLIAEIHFSNNYFLDLGLNLNMLAGQNMNWQAENFDGNFSETAADPIDGLEFGNLSMTVGIGKEKYITRQLSILINPSLRINLTALNTTAPVKSYPYAWGLNAGLRYYFD